jgi:hypothetical protein
MAIYKVKRFSIHRPSEQEIKEKIKEVVKLLPPEYNKWLKISEELEKLKKQKRYFYLNNFDVAFPDFVVMDLEYIADELLSYPNKKKITIAALDSYDTNYLYYNFETKEWSWRDYYAGKLNFPLKSAIISYEEKLRDDWRNDTEWLDEEKDRKDFEEYTKILIDTLKRKL